MKLSDYVINFLHTQKIEHIFYLIGGMVTHLVDSTVSNKEVACITMHHEQAAAFAAEGYARSNGKLGVAMATSGPGATNLITGIGDCFFDSVPCLFITGQVNTYEGKTDVDVRQAGFQETDIVSIAKPITKGARLVAKAEDIRRDLEWAVYLAQSGRPGPVLLDIPMNIQRAEIDPEILEPFKIEITAKKSINTLDCFTKSACKDENMQAGRVITTNISFDEIIQLLKSAKRPVVLVGGGVRVANAIDELFDFIAKTNIPVVTSLMGVDAFDHNSPCYVGMIGTYGHRWANIVLANADFLLVLGSRLDTRQTGTKPSNFARAATVVHVDIDPKELNRTINAKYLVEMHLKDFLVTMNSYKDIVKITVSQEWLNHIELCKQKFKIVFPIDKTQIINPCELIQYVSKQVASNAIVTIDVGQHQMWAALFFELKCKQRMLISGGMGSMGFALPAAIGAAFAEPERQIIVIVGDGGFQLNIQELQTIKRNNLNIKILLLNNQSLGMVRQFQELYFGNRTEGTLIGYSNPDFMKIADAYGIASVQITIKDEIAQKVEQFLAEPTCTILEVIMPPSTTLEPKLSLNDPIEDQEPKLSRDELKSVMLIDLCA